MSSKTKLLFLTESFNIGGQEKALISLLRNIDLHKYDITVCVIAETGGLLPEALAIPGIKYQFVIPSAKGKAGKLVNLLKGKLIYSWLSAKWVYRLFIPHGFDVEIAYCEGFLTKLISESTSQDTKKIAWVHTDMLDNDWPLETGIFQSFDAEKKAYGKFENIICVSDIVASGMRAKYGTDNVSTIYNIIDRNDILLKSGHTPNFSQPNQTGYRLVGLGRLSYVKGFDLLLDAISIAVNDYGLDIRLTIVGDGQERAALEAKARRNNITERVVFAGAQPNPYPYLKEADLFVCPSRKEGFNIAILEAMALGLPVVAVKSAGPSEIIGANEYGVLTEGTPESLAEGIRCILSDGTMDKYRMCSQQRANDFSIESQINKIDLLFHEI